MFKSISLRKNSQLEILFQLLIFHLLVISQLSSELCLEKDKEKNIHTPQLGTLELLVLINRLAQLNSLKKLMKLSEEERKEEKKLKKLKKEETNQNNKSKEKERNNKKLLQLNQKLMMMISLVMMMLPQHLQLKNPKLKSKVKKRSQQLNLSSYLM